MRHHHYIKYLFVLLLFLPTSLMAQNKEEKMPGHITKIQKLEDVNVTGNRPHFIRLKGYYRSYQTNDSVMKYFNDGIVEYYINLKNGKTDLNAYSKRNLHNSRLVSEDKKRAFMVSDKGTFRPWPEEKTLIEQYRKKYQLKDSEYLSDRNQPASYLQESDAPAFRLYPDRYLRPCGGNLSDKS